MMSKFVPSANSDGEDSSSSSTQSSLGSPSAMDIPNHGKYQIYWHFFLYFEQFILHQFDCFSLWFDIRIPEAVAEFNQT